MYDYDVDALTAMLSLLGGFVFVLLAIVIAMYVLCSMARMKVLKIYGYANPWMAWVPILCEFAIADAACEGKDKLPLFGASAPSWLFKFYWLISFAVGFVPVVGTVASIVLQVILLGTIYTHIYARIEDKELSDCQVLGYISGFFTIIAIVKFLCYDKDKRLA